MKSVTICSYLVIQHLGLTRAMDFVMRKRIVSADEAFELSLVNEVVEDDKLETAVMQLTEELVNRPQVAMQWLKRSMYAAAESTFEQACEDIASKTAIADRHPNTRAGVFFCI